MGSMQRICTLLVLVGLAMFAALRAQDFDNKNYFSPVEKLPLPPPEQPIPYSHCAGSAGIGERPFSVS